MGKGVKECVEYFMCERFKRRLVLLRGSVDLVLRKLGEKSLRVVSVS